MPLSNAVLAELKKLTVKFEGGHQIDYMFKDAYNRVGTAYGLDLDRNTVGYSPNNDIAAQNEGILKAQGYLARPVVLPWVKWKRRSSGAPVTDPEEIRKAWVTIKSLLGTGTYARQPSRSGPSVHRRLVQE